MRLDRLEKVLSAIERLDEVTKGKNRTSVMVGYFGVNYALHVHENKEARHEVGKAKFLEDPARRLAPELAKNVQTAMKNGATVEEGLTIAGLRLQRESQKEVPVDTGNLKGSADVRVEQ